MKQHQRFLSEIFQFLEMEFSIYLNRRVYLSAFRTFVRFALVWFCLFPLPLRVWDGLRLVIVALPGLFSYLFRNGSRLY